MAKETRNTMTFARVRKGEPIGLHTGRIRNHVESKPHDHLFHELVYVESGSAMHMTVEGLTPLKAGNLIVIQPQVWHAYKKPKRLTIVNFLIEPSLLLRHAELLDQVPGTVELFRRRPADPARTSPLVLDVPRADQSRLKQLFETIMNEQETCEQGWQTLATLSALEVLVMVARIGSKTLGRGGKVADDDQAVSGRAQEAVHEVAGYLEANYAKAADLTELAERAHLSPAHLSRCFSKRMGMGVVQFMHRLRVEEACRLLRTTRRSVSEIAAAVGYDEVAYFSRRFKKETGRTPREYRSSDQAEINRQ